MPEDAVCTYAAGDERYYFVECILGDERKIYVYDTLHAMWHVRSGVENVTAILNTPENVKIITANEVLNINSPNYGEWEFELGFGEKEFASKHICSVYFRYSLGKDSEFDVYLRNRHKSYKLAYVAEMADNNVMRLRLPVSCDRSHRLCFSGKGYFALNSIDIGFRETGIYD